MKSLRGKSRSPSEGGKKFDGQKEREAFSVNSGEGKQGR